MRYSYQPVQFCFGKVSLFSKNWYKPVDFVVLDVVVAEDVSADKAILDVEMERIAFEATLQLTKRLALCNKDMVCICECLC